MPSCWIVEKHMIGNLVEQTTTLVHNHQRCDPLWFNYFFKLMAPGVYGGLGVTPLRGMGTSLNAAQFGLASKAALKANCIIGYWWLLWSNADFKTPFEKHLVWFRYSCCCCCCCCSLCDIHIHSMRVHFNPFWNVRRYDVLMYRKISSLITHAHWHTRTRTRLPFSPVACGKCFSQHLDKFHDFHFFIWLNACSNENWKGILIRQIVLTHLHSDNWLFQHICPVGMNDFRRWLRRLFGVKRFRIFIVLLFISFWVRQKLDMITCSVRILYCLFDVCHFLQYYVSHYSLWTSILAIALTEVTNSLTWSSMTRHMNLRFVPSNVRQTDEKSPRRLQSTLLTRICHPTADRWSIDKSGRCVNLPKLPLPWIHDLMGMSISIFFFSIFNHNWPMQSCAVMISHTHMPHLSFFLSIVLHKRQDEQQQQ